MRRAALPVEHDCQGNAQSIVDVLSETITMIAANGSATRATPPALRAGPLVCGHGRVDRVGESTEIVIPLGAGTRSRTANTLGVGRVLAEVPADVPDRQQWCHNHISGGHRALRGAHPHRLIPFSSQSGARVLSNTAAPAATNAAARPVMQRAG